MLIHEWYHIPTWLSLTVIVLVLAASIGFSLKSERAAVRATAVAEVDAAVVTSTHAAEAGNGTSTTEVHADSGASAESGPPFDER
jgi:guanyl-specific ribonuclease Sa